MLFKLQIVLFLSASLIMISGVDAKEKCKYTETLPDDYPCYKPDDIIAWANALRTANCSSSMTPEQFKKYFNCLKTLSADYVTTVDIHLMRTPLQCGEKLVDNSALAKDQSPEASVSLFCKTLPPGKEEIKPDSKAFKLMSCAVYEYSRKFESKVKDGNLFKC